MEKTTSEVASRSLQVTQLLQAPVDLVWKVWTTPEDIACWWGPDGFTNTIHTMDVQPHGEWRLTMHGPDGKTYPNRSVFLEIVPHQKIVFQHFNPDYLATIVFTAHEKETIMAWSMVFETPELFETVVRVFKADEGLKQNADKLKQYLNQIKHQ